NGLRPTLDAAGFSRVLEPIAPGFQGGVPREAKAVVVLAQVVERRARMPGLVRGAGGGPALHEGGEKGAAGFFRDRRRALAVAAAAGTGARLFVFLRRQIILAASAGSKKMRR